MQLSAASVIAANTPAAARGTSRNRVILQACEELLAEHQGDWPTGFFESSLRPEELEELRAGGQELEGAILAARRDREVPPL
jgi:hypothetical protein